MRKKKKNAVKILRREDMFPVLVRIIGKLRVCELHMVYITVFKVVKTTIVIIHSWSIFNRKLLVYLEDATLTTHWGSHHSGSTAQDRWFALQQRRLRQVRDELNSAFDHIVFWENLCLLWRAGNCQPSIFHPIVLCWSWTTIFDGWINIEWWFTHQNGGLTNKIRVEM